MKISRLTKLHELQEWGFVATYFLFGILNGYCFQCFNTFNFSYHVPDSRTIGTKTVGTGPNKQQNHTAPSEKVISTILLLWVFQK